MSSKSYGLDQSIGISARSGPQPAASRTGPIETVHSSLTAADILADEVRAFVDDLIGALPEPTGSVGGAEYNDGRLNSLAERARSVNVNVSRACEALTRLRNVL